MAFNATNPPAYASLINGLHTQEHLDSMGGRGLESPLIQTLRRLRAVRPNQPVKFQNPKKMALSGALRPKRLPKL